MLDRIQVDPRVCEGRPTTHGLRITVEFVLKLLGDGYTAADIVREYPELEEEDVYQGGEVWRLARRRADITNRMKLLAGRSSIDVRAGGETPLRSICCVWLDALELSAEEGVR
jgi:uncharacterized protein (DUF433 family)